MSSDLTNPAPAWLDKGDQAWQLTAGTLVALQSIPGLAILYAGFVKKKWAINSAFMVFYAFSATLICWVIWAYKMGFGKQWGNFPLVGTPGPVLTMQQNLAQTELPAAGLSTNFNLSTMIYFQFVFAAITVIILGGSLLGRINILAWMVFVPLWITFSYTVGAFSIWGGGFLYKMGVLDYSGGYVIHLSSGTAGFTAAYWLGPRLQRDRDSFYPNNILLMLVGAGILWVCWNGFNGGDPYAASPDAGVAVLNTNICTAMSLLVWTMLDYIFFKKPSVIGAVQGEITGLVAITPAAGFVTGWGAIVIGACSGSIPWISMNILGRQKWMKQVDDVMGTVHTHMVAGFTGGFLTGIFATIDGCAAFGLTNPGGAIEGNGRQVWLQIVGALFIIGLNLFMTSVICLFIKYVLRIPLRMSDEHLMVGDDAVHGEEAYALFFEGERSHLSLHGAGLESGQVTEGGRVAVTSPTSGTVSPQHSARDKEEVKID
ncbi:ammonium transporter, putative [Talaromyces stipitatus ATCC 10500]|uniref:Ammonium transporter, putative n=1 Tax=Talaromyces stipitatus (strain ATCC 10500 / CBS 375.48 / QM 6759 / NRRL 1006) TaxID=441959 RepID=B8LZY3_TALSN|nr:ammonium transporter, putative [Talaromyces stipitatus ATCC 10500]EED20915.1 ammonium transporter, putative [Talaromyces stipitatus ATCC 10500]